MQIRPMLSADAEAVLAIYDEGIKGRNATFETSPPGWEEFDLSHLEHSRFVAEVNDQVVGWIALLPSSQRCAYRGVAELSVYISKTAHRQGIGTALMDAVIAASEEHGIWTLLAGIFRENVASVRLHERAGFRLIGHNERVGTLDGQWRDVLRFERRSKTVGV